MFVKALIKSLPTSAAWTLATELLARFEDPVFENQKASCLLRSGKNQTPAT